MECLIRSYFGGTICRSTSGGGIRWASTISWTRLIGTPWRTAPVLISPPASRRSRRRSRRCGRVGAGGGGGGGGRGGEGGSDRVFGVAGGGPPATPSSCT